MKLPKEGCFSSLNSIRYSPLRPIGLERPETNNLPQVYRDTFKLTIENNTPTIDIGPWMSSKASNVDLNRVVKEVHDACSTYGFFNLIGHGVPVEAQTRVWEASKLFFDLPLEEKMEVSVDKSMGKAFRDYEPSLIQTHQDGLLPDTKEVKRCPC